MKCPKSVFTNYWVEWVWQSYFDWHHCLQCKQFLFVDSVLNVKTKIYVQTLDSLVPDRKIGSYAYGTCHIRAIHCCFRRSQRIIRMMRTTVQVLRN